MYNTQPSKQALHAARIERDRSKRRFCVPAVTALMAVFLFSGFIMPGPVPASAADDPVSKQDLEEVERERKAHEKRSKDLQRKAKSVRKELRVQSNNLVILARNIRKMEKQVARLNADISNLEHTQATIERELRKDQNRYTALIAALQRMALHPPEAALAQPGDLPNTVRSAVLLRTVTPKVQNRANELSRQLQILKDTQVEKRRRREELASVSATLESTRARLKKMQSRKSKLHKSLVRRSDREASRARELAREAKDLRDLVAKLEADRKKQNRPAGSSVQEGFSADYSEGGGTPVNGVQFNLVGSTLNENRGRLPMPVTGRIIGRYGETSEGGLTRKGIVIETVSGATVVAPYVGRVAFAGNFRRYGRLLIIEYGDGYHGLLAGMSRIDTTVGSDILAGEPLGVMGAPGGDGRPKLYVELRRDGKPINPLPWFTRTAQTGNTDG